MSEVPLYRVLLSVTERGGECLTLQPPEWGGLTLHLGIDPMYA